MHLGEFLQELRLAKLFDYVSRGAFLAKLRNKEKVGEAFADMVLKLRSREDWQRFCERLWNMDGMVAAAEKIPNGGAFCKELGNIRSRLEVLAANKNVLAFDEESCERLAEQLIRIFPRFGSLLRPCEERRNSPPHANLADEIDNYLAGLGIVKVEMREGAPMDEWNNLNMENDVVPEATDDPHKIGTIGPIIMQPRKLSYLNSEDEVDVRHFGGRCVLYTKKLK